MIANVHEIAGQNRRWLRLIRQTFAAGILGLATWALAAPPDAYAAKGSCPVKKTRVKVTLKEDPGRVTVNRRLSQKQLTAMMRKKAKSDHPGNCSTMA